MASLLLLLPHGQAADTCSAPGPSSRPPASHPPGQQHGGRGGAHRAAAWCPHCRPRTPCSRSAPHTQAAMPGGPAPLTPPGHPPCVTGLHTGCTAPAPGRHTPSLPAAQGSGWQRAPSCRNPFSTGAGCTRGHCTEAGAYLSRSGRVLAQSALPALLSGVTAVDERTPRVVVAAPCPAECGCCKMAAERAELTPLAASPTPPSCPRTASPGPRSARGMSVIHARGFLGYPCCLSVFLLCQGGTCVVEGDLRDD